MICSTHSWLGIKLVIFNLLRSTMLLPSSFPIVSVTQSRGGYILRLTKQLRHGPGMYREYHWPRAAGGQSHVCWYLPGETARPRGTRDSRETGLRCHWKRIVIMMPTSLWGCHMSVMAYHSTDNSTVWSTACSGRQQTKHQNSRIPRWPVDSPQQKPEMRKVFLWHEVAGDTEVCYDKMTAKLASWQLSLFNALNTFTTTQCTIQPARHITILCITTITAEQILLSKEHILAKFNQHLIASSK